MSNILLVLNTGSSSVKFAIYPQNADSQPMLRGKIAGIGRAPDFTALNDKGEKLEEGALAQLDKHANHEDIVTMLLDWLQVHKGNTNLTAVGHRVVHGGRKFTAPVLLDETTLTELGRLASLAPLHQPHNLAAIRAIAARYPDLPQVACFDTSFHRTQSHLAQLFALPRELSDEGIIRYGFHGLSYDYIASILPKHLGHRAKGAVVIAHLGNGASMCALKAGKSVATSMGFTALDGLMMGRRSGSVDPGVILHLMQEKGMTAAQIETLLYQESGLLGVSGISNNMQVLQESTAPQAAEAIDLYCYRAASVLASLLPAIGGLDALVFTAGIGENSALVRQKICAHLAWVGIALDKTANEKNTTHISAASSSCDVLVLKTDEECLIARETHAIIQT